MKVFKINCQKCFTRLQKMKNTQSKIKPINGIKKSEKSNCVVCRSNKSRFLKPKHSNKK